MITGYFLPKWYVKDRLNDKNKRLKLIAAIFLIINVVFLNIIILCQNKVKGLNEVIEEKSNMHVLKTSKSIKGNNFKSIETYSDFLKYFGKYEQIRNININDDKIDLEFIDQNNSFQNVIKSIESSNKFTIISIASLKDNYGDKSKINSDKKIWKLYLKHK